MKISIEDMRKNATNMLLSLEEHGIRSLPDIARLSGNELKVSSDSDAILSLDHSPLRDGTKSLIVSYAIPFLQGNSLEGRFNINCKKSMIFVKYGNRLELEGYNPIMPDPLGNIVYLTSKPGLDFKWFVDNLKALSKYKL